MIGIYVKLPIKEGKVDECIAAFQELMKSVGQEEGCLLYSLFKDKKDPNTLIMMERYKDKDALGHHGSTEYFKAFQGKMAGFLAGAPEMKILEEVASI
ncbi:MAG: antibiotic biosynthesis monooxygenase [Proteobacteria bacterium]|nr:antibiotic biosynthesis monooxygenase [Pseudomonadota bacterium]